MLELDFFSETFMSLGIGFNVVPFPVLCIALCGFFFTTYDVVPLEVSLVQATALLPIITGCKLSPRKIEIGIT